MSGDPEGSERRFTNRLAVYWEKLRRDRHGLIPLEKDVDIEALEDIWDHCFMIEVGAQGETIEELDYKYAYMGESIIDAYGDDLTGKQVYNELIALHTRKLLLKFLTVVKTSQPLSDESQFFNLKGNLIRYRQRFVPLGSLSEDIGFIMGVMTWRAFSTEEEAERAASAQNKESPSIKAMEEFALTEEEAAVFHPEIRDYGCDSIANIFSWKPTSAESVCYNLDIRIGSTCSENAELFQVMIVSPEYIRDPDSREVLEKGGKYLVVPNYSWDACESLLNHMVEKISGASWADVKNSLAQYFDVG